LKSKKKGFLQVKGIRYMHLTKLELQEMLREMGVKFSHTESYENLKKLFQAENHIRWMGEMSPNGRRSAGGLKRVLRKKTTDCSKEMVVLSKPKAAKNNMTPLYRSISKSDKNENCKSKNIKVPSFTRSETVKSKIPCRIDQSDLLEGCRNIFSTVLRRSQHCCEFCGVQSDADKEEQSSLKPFYIKPLTFGGERSVKNMVALCTTCYQRLSAHAQPSDLKQLKRTARSKIIRSIEIQRKPRFEGG
jgi:hypothetical protein